MNLGSARAAMVWVALSTAGGSVGLAGCGWEVVTSASDRGDTGPDRSDQVFDVPVLDVHIDIATSDWDSLRRQRRTRHRHFGTRDCLAAPVDNQYTWHLASVTIDGDDVGRVGVRKKGQFGSQSTVRPSLKLKFDEVDSGRRWRSLERLALNNSRQDPSYARTCISYQVFRTAGVPAPRCTLAHLTVNGADLGVYVALEEVDEDFLERNFDDAGGNLYEGNASDFRPGFIGSFEQETNRSSDASRADLAAVLDVLESSSGPELLPALGAVVDVDAFFRFWTVESLLWHRDGYAGNANNFFVYADPSDGGRLHFLPWGADGTLTQDNRPSVPDSVLAFTSLTRRIYLTPAGRERYYQELAAVIADAWRPRAVADKVARMAELARPRLPDAGWRADLDDARAAMLETIATRGDAIEAALAEGQPAWTEPLRVAPCRIPEGPISGTFATTWGTLDDSAFAAGTGSLTAELDGEPVAVTGAGARAGAAPSGPWLQLMAQLDDGRLLSLVANFPGDARWFESYTTAGVHPLLSPPLVVGLTELAGPGDALGTFEIGEGTITFDAIGTEDGAAVQGSFEGTLYRVPPPE